MLLGATIFWAVSFPVMKALAMEQQKLSPEGSGWFFALLGAMYRFGSAGMILALIICRDLRNITRLEFEQGLGLGLFGVGGVLFQMDGLNYTAASTSAFLTQSYCLFIPLWVALMHRRLPPRKVFFSVALVVTGLAILAGLNFRDLRLGCGEVETLIASLLFAGQILWLERPRYANTNPLRFSVVMFLVMCLLCLPGVWLTAPSAAACLRSFASPAALGFLGLLVVFCTLGGYLVMNRWQRDVTATEAGMVYSVEPVFTSVLTLFLPAWISIWANVNYPNESLTSRLLLGGGLITMANVLLQKR